MKPNRLFIHVASLVIILAFYSCNSYNGNVSKAKNNYITNSNEATSDLDRLIQPYKKELEVTMSEVLNTSDMELVRGQPEGKLGNYVSDLSLNQVNVLAKSKGYELANICVLNNGGLRTTIPKGEVTRGRLFELMPFENELVILKLNQTVFQKLLDFIAKYDGVPIAGFKMGIKEGKPLLDTKTLLDKSYVYVCTSDYLSKGGDNMFFFQEADSIVNTGLKVRDAIINHTIKLKDNNQTVSAKLDGRIYNGK